MHEQIQATAFGGVIASANAIASVASGTEGWFPVVIQSGAIGLLAFVLWHVFAKFIPSLQADNRETLNKMSLLLDNQRKEFTQTIKEERAESQAARREQNDAIRELSQAVRELRQ